jgi:hypothetical protein
VYIETPIISGGEVMVKKSAFVSVACLAMSIAASAVAQPPGTPAAPANVPTPNAGHVLHFETPDVFNRELLAFLKS